MNKFSSSLKNGKKDVVVNISPTDTQLTYWYNWSVCNEQGEEIIRFKKNSHFKIDREKIDDINYLIEIFKKYPTIAFDEPTVKRKLEILRQKGFKSAESENKYNQVIKAMLIDRRGKKKFEDLKEIIFSNQDIFKKILHKVEGKKMQIEEAIAEFVGTRENEFKNYERIFYSYKKTYKKMIKKGMTVKEIFAFLRCAAENIECAYTQFDYKPDGRPLHFIKKTSRTWYMMGNEFEAPIFNLQ